MCFNFIASSASQKCVMIFGTILVEESAFCIPENTSDKNSPASHMA